MSESVSLPALGESVTEGTVTRWLKNVGDRVEVDEPLVEVSTDKVDTEIPSPIAGVIEAILVQEDETVAVGTPLVTIGDGSGAGAATPVASPAAAEPLVAAAAPEVAAPEVAAPEVAAPEVVAPEVVAPPAPAVVAPVAVAPVAVAPVAVTPSAHVAAPVSVAATGSHASNSGYVTPIVRKLANDTGVNLSNVTGTGIGGRIRKEDILQASVAPSSSAPARARLAVSPLRGTVVPMTRLRKVVAERAVISMQSTAQLTTVVEVDVTGVANLRDSVKDRFFTATGVKLSFLPFFTLAATEALKSFPIINATVDGDNIVYPGQENVSIAVDTERGLLTPVVKNAGELNVAEYALAIADVAERTRNNQLKPDELAGGTFTITNTGSRGALFDTPVVFLPQLAILGTGIVTKRPIVMKAAGQEVIAIRSMVYLALSYDHRIIDGADAARFLTAVKNRLEDAAFDADLGI